MTEEHNSSGESLFGRLSEIKPPREDAPINESTALIPDGAQGSLTQRMQSSPKMSDTQVVDQRLFPKIKEGADWLNVLLVGRVFPEQLIPLKRIIGKHLLKRFYSDISAAEATVLADVAVGIPIDGEGRMDIIHMFSKLSDKEEDKDKAKLI